MGAVGIAAEHDECARAAGSPGSAGASPCRHDIDSGFDGVDSAAGRSGGRAAALVGALVQWPWRLSPCRPPGTALSAASKGQAWEASRVCRRMGTDSQYSRKVIQRASARVSGGAIWLWSAPMGRSEPFSPGHRGAPGRGRRRGPRRPRGRDRSASTSLNPRARLLEVRARGLSDDLAG